MPAPQKYAPPHEQLLALAREARAAGVPFDEFWDQAVPPPLWDEQKQRYRPTRSLAIVGRGEAPPGEILWPYDTADRHIAYMAMVEAREGWQRAYEGTPATPGEQALGVIGPLLAGGNLSGEGVKSAA